MKKLIHLIYRTVVHRSTPVTDVATGRKEIAEHTEMFGFIIKTTYKPI